VATRVIGRSSDPVPLIGDERMHRDVHSQRAVERVTFSHVMQVARNTNP